jgi:hypothetical protein
MLRREIRKPFPQIIVGNRPASLSGCQWEGIKHLK